MFAVFFALLSRLVPSALFEEEDRVPLLGTVGKVYCTLSGFFSLRTQSVREESWKEMEIAC